MSSEEFVRRAETQWADANSTTDQTQMLDAPDDHTVDTPHTKDLLADEK
jgi:hypothetical protein